MSVDDHRAAAKLLPARRCGGPPTSTYRVNSVSTTRVCSRERQGLTLNE